MICYCPACAKRTRHEHVMPANRKIAAKWMCTATGCGRIRSLSAEELKEIKEEAKARAKGWL